MVYLTRKIEFAARTSITIRAIGGGEPAIFGKCNNPHGHGHNYTLEVTIAVNRIP
jgi:6-pyruvoyltetrahydropterin/6-carboxytetrahydropterin synthase